MWVRAKTLAWKQPTAFAQTLRETSRRELNASSNLYAPASDSQVAQLADRPLHRLSLSDLVRHGRPPLSTEALLSSANFTSSLIPIRLAHRIKALRNLPFIVVSNPYMSKIHGIYQHSLSTLLPFLDRDISTIEEETRFTDVLADLVQQHSNTIPALARGFLDGRRYIEKDRVTKFLEEHLRARIGTRLIAEQHIALHLSSQPHANSISNDVTVAPPSSYIGIIDTELQPAAILRQTAAFVGDLCEYRYGVRPILVVNGLPEATIAQIPSHLEYIFTELLKNAFRATIESGNEQHPIEATLTLSTTRPGHQSSSDEPSRLRYKSSSMERGIEESKILTIRLRDRGGGIAPDVLPRIWGYSFTTFSEKAAAERISSSSYSVDGLDTLSASGTTGSTIAGLGYGLPLGRAYAEHFGGGVQVESLWGWGTDVYLRLRGLRGF